MGAIADYDEAIRLDPKYARAFTNRGNVYDAKSEYDRAIADHSEAIRLDPKYAVAINNRGIVYIHKKDYERAAADFAEVIRLVPNVWQPLRNRARSISSPESPTRRWPISMPSCGSTRNPPRAFTAAASPN
jgi:tetratricopeptide (TPR) repeat protein